MKVESTPVHVLLIEDDEDDYILIRDCLMDQDSTVKFELHWVQDYQTGLKNIHRGNYDVYLIDHYLGENSGLELLDEAHRAGCQVPMIIVTGQSAREFDHAAMKAGASDYLIKSRLDGQCLERSIRYALERNRLVKKIHELAVRDDLTGLFNRRELHRFMDYEVISSRRYNHSFSILMMDVDDFKMINDRFGHRVGDEILNQVGQVLIDCTRGCDLQARYGGDEFIIVFPETPARQACTAAERIRKSVSDINFENFHENGMGDKIKISVSTGVAEFPYDANTSESLIDIADQALYQAKNKGGNCVVRFFPKNEQVINSR